MSTKSRTLLSPAGAILSSLRLAPDLLPISQPLIPLVSGFPGLPVTAADLPPLSLAPDSFIVRPVCSHLFPSCVIPHHLLSFCLTRNTSRD